MTSIGFILLAVGAFVTLTNVYLSFLRYPIYLASGRSRLDYRSVSGIPVVGSLLLWISIPLLASPEFQWLAAILSLFDTGGVHWFLGTMWWKSQLGDLFRKRADEAYAADVTIGVKIRRRDDTGDTVGGQARVS